MGEESRPGEKMMALKLVQNSPPLFNVECDGCFRKFSSKGISWSDVFCSIQHSVWIGIWTNRWLHFCETCSKKLTVDDLKGL